MHFPKANFRSKSPYFHNFHTIEPLARYSIQKWPGLFRANCLCFRFYGLPSDFDDSHDDDFLPSQFVLFRTLTAKSLLIFAPKSQKAHQLMPPKTQILYPILLNFLSTVKIHHDLCWHLA